MVEVVAAGEILVDMIPTEVGDYRRVVTFTRNFGGAPFNYAVAMRRLGHTVGAVCAVGNDPFGDFLLDVLAREGIDTSMVRRVDRRTTLAFVVRYEGGERDFFFYREPWAPTADTMIEGVDLDYVRGARILHFSGVALSHEPARGTIMSMARAAREAGVMVSFDPNLRWDLWPDRGQLRSAYDGAFRVSDVVLLARDEAEALFGTADPRIAAERVLERYEPGYVAVKLGREGAYVRTGEGDEVFKPAFRVEAVDTTGAGDAWAAGFEAMLLEGRDLDEAVTVANAVGALTVTKVGAISALPTREELARFLKDRGYRIVL